MASTYKTMRGTAVDMNRLLNQNEMTVAVGNMKVNARGDSIVGGKVIPKEHAVNPSFHVPAENRKIPVVETVTPIAQSAVKLEPVVEVTASSDVLVSDTTITTDKKSSKKQTDSETA